MATIEIDVSDEKAMPVLVLDEPVPMGKFALDIGSVRLILSLEQFGELVDVMMANGEHG